MSTQSTDKALREEVALDQLQAHNAAIAKGVRLTGSADEAEAFDYIAAQCETFGLNVRRYAVDALVSLPGAASLAVTGPEARDFPCITHSASRPTGPGGITASLVYACDGLAADYAKIDARGKIALVEGLAGAPKASDGDAAGVLGIICINPAGLHEMNFSPVWGTPTPATAPKLPQLAAISVRKEIGDELRELLDAGEVTVRIETEIDASWRPIPVLTADLPGADEDRFVLLSGHVDSWYHGAMDNASANATMLEIGQIFAAHPGELRRGLRLAFETPRSATVSSQSRKRGHSRACSRHSGVGRPITPARIVSKGSVICPPNGAGVQTSPMISVVIPWVILETQRPSIISGIIEWL